MYPPFFAFVVVLVDTVVVFDTNVLLFVFDLLPCMQRLD